TNDANHSIALLDFLEQEFLEHCASWVGVSAAVECAHDAHDFVFLCLRQLRVHRQRQYFVRCTFGFGTLPLLVAEVCKALLEMQRERIVYGRPDAMPRQVRLELIALRY